MTAAASTADCAPRRSARAGRARSPFPSGILYFLAFPGVDLWPLAFVALAPLIVALRGQTPRRAAWLGWLAGFTMTMIGFYWLLEMLETFSGFRTAAVRPLHGDPLRLPGRAHRAARLSLRARRARGLARSGSRSRSASSRASWRFPLLFPWFYAATVHQVPALVQLAEIGGPILVALPLVAVNLAVAELVVARRERRAVRRAPRCLALAAAPVVAALYGVVRIREGRRARRSRAEGPRRPRAGQHESCSASARTRRKACGGTSALTRELQAEGPLDLVVWSETSVMGAVDEQARRAPRFPSISRAGSACRRSSARCSRGPSTTSASAFSTTRRILTDAAGEREGRYDKQFLLAFGEYLPFGDTFPVLYRYSPNSGRFTPGNVARAAQPTGATRSRPSSATRTSSRAS